MKLLFSKAEEIDGDFTVDELGEPTGHIQVYLLTIVHKGTRIPVSKAGTILIDSLKGAPSVPLEGVVLSIEDEDIHGPHAPQKMTVRGRVSLQGEGLPKIITTFVGTMHTTSYLQRAWDAILDPNWDGNWSF